MLIPLKKLVFILVISITAIGFASCSENTKNVTSDTEIVDKEHNSKYICPMYCEGSGSTEPGDCPVCHMHYVENKDYKAPK